MRSWEANEGNLGTCRAGRQGLGPEWPAWLRSKQNFVTYDMLLVFTLYSGTPPLFGLLSTNRRRKTIWNSYYEKSLFECIEFFSYWCLTEFPKRNMLDEANCTPKCNIFDLFLQMVTRTKKIFVGGLSAPSTLEDVKNYFEQFGRVSQFLFPIVTRR